MLIPPGTNLIDLPLSTRISNSLQKESITTLGDVALCTEADLFDVDQMGLKRIADLEAFLARHDLRLRKGDEPFWKRAVEIYGSHEKVAMWPILMHLFSWGSDPKEIRSDKMRVVNQLKSAELLLIEDLLGVRWHEHQSLLKELFGELRAERLTGWLYGAGIYYWM